MGGDGTPGDVDVPTSTVHGLEPVRAGAHAAVARRLFLGGLSLVVVAGGAGVLGVHTSWASASGAGYDLSLQYPLVARAGLDTTWQVTVRRTGGFEGPVTLAVTAAYFDIYETQGFHPDVSSSTRDGSRLYLTFDAPPGDVLMVDFDAYVQPSSQRGRRATLSVVDGSHTEVSIPFRTWIVP